MRGNYLIFGMAMMTSVLLAQAPTTTGIPNNVSTGTTLNLLSCLDRSGNALSGSATSLVVTVGGAVNSGVAGKYADTTDSVTLAAGDEISVQATNHSSSTSASIADMCVLLTP